MDPFLGEIRMVGFNFAPQGWAACNGQLLPIARNTALFALLGTQFGGDGVTTFALPDLRGHVAMYQTPDSVAYSVVSKQNEEIIPENMNHKIETEKTRYDSISSQNIVKFIIAVRGIYPPRP